MQSFDTESDDTTQLSKTTALLPVCPVDGLPRGACRTFILPNGDELAVFNVNGEYYATDNSCPHRGAALSEGAMSGHLIECAWHGWQFDVRTGECVTVKENLKTYVTRVVEGMLVIEV